MSKEQLQTQEKKETVASLLKLPAYADRFKEVLRDRAPQFMASVIQVSRTLGEDVEPRSILGSCMIAASLDLPIEKTLGLAWIVPYRQGKQKYAQFQISARGLTNLAMRSGQYASISVPRGINKEAFKGYDSIGNPMIDWNAVDIAKEPAGYGFGWRMINGGESIFYWSVEKIKAHAQRYSQAYRSGGETPWKTHFPEMACKTVVKNSLSQFGTLSVQMRSAITTDAGVVLDVDAEPIYPDNPKEVGAGEEKPNLSDGPEPSDNDGNV